MVPQMVMSILSPPPPFPDEQIPATSRFCQSRLKKPFLPFKLNIIGPFIRGKIKRELSV